MNFEDVQLDDVQSVGQFLMSYNKDLGLTFYNFDDKGDDSVRQIMTVAALTCMLYYMKASCKDNEENVKDLYDILLDNPTYNNREDYEVYRDSLLEFKGQIDEVVEAIKETRSYYQLA